MMQLVNTYPKPLSEMTRSQRKRKKRDLIEGSSATRRRQLNRLYKRDRGVCYACNKPVDRSDASREHLFPLRDFPHLAKDESLMVLTHRLCNT